jgi:translation elongation factor EF-Tu-like GTPase
MKKLIAITFLFILFSATFIAQEVMLIKANNLNQFNPSETTIKSQKKHSKFKATVYFLSTDEGGRQSSISDNLKVVVDINSESIEGVIKLPEDITTIAPGDDPVKNITITLSSGVEIESKLMFTLKEGLFIIASGAVTELIE